MAEGEEQERTPIFTPTFLPLAAVSRHTHGRVKPAPAESRLTHAGYATSAPSHGGAGAGGGGGGGGKGRDSTFTCGRQCKSPPSAQPACRAACWPWRYGPSKWPVLPYPPPNVRSTICQRCPGLGKWKRTRVGREDPDVAVSLWEDAHQPRVKVVQPASEEYSHLTFPAHHRPPHPFAPQMMAKEQCHHQRNDLANQPSQWQFSGQR